MKTAMFLRRVAAYFFALLIFMAVVRHLLFLAINGSHGVAAGTLLKAALMGLRTDVAVAAWLCGVPLLIFAGQMFRPGRWLNVSLNIYNILLSVAVPLVILADASLYKFWNLKLDVSVFNFLNHPTEAFASVSSLYALGRLVAWIVLGFVLWWLLDKVCGNVTLKRREVSAAPVIAVVFSALVLFVAYRGIPRSRKVYGKYFPERVCVFDNSFSNHVALNPLLNLGYSAVESSAGLGKYDVMPAAQAQEIAGAMLPREGLPPDTLLNCQRPDIVLIIAESFSAQTLPSLYTDSDIAVANRLDSLAREGVMFTRCYADSYQTDLSMPCILSGYHTLPGQRPLRHIGKMQTMPSLANKLREAGYNATAFYGGNANYMNIQCYWLSSGFDEVFSLPDYPKEEAVSKWGIPDGTMLGHLYDEMVRPSRAANPQFYTLLTLSSHPPYDVPEPRSYDTAAANAFAYTDKCIAEFINKLSATPLWDNLLIIIGDHGSNGVISSSDPDYGNIAFIMSGGAIKEPRKIDTIMNQHDLASTLLGQLGIDHSEFRLSRDVLSKAYAYPAAICSFPNGFALVDDAGTTMYDSYSALSAQADTPQIRLGKAFQQIVAEYFKGL